VKLSAAGSSDPDGDRIGYQWFSYPEAGTFPGRIAIAGERQAEATVTITRVGRGPAKGTAHVILAVEDDGEPSLSSYRRVILEVDEEE
jgi:hypothetical protein